MGANAAETVREIEEVRDRLQSDVETLEGRLPAPAVLAKRAAGVAVGGGLAGAGFWFLVRKLRGGRRKKQAPAAVQPVLQVVPSDFAERMVERLDDERVKRWALVAGGAWILFRLAELRQLRKLVRPSGSAGTG